MRTDRMSFICVLMLAACADSPVEPFLGGGGELQVRPRFVRTLTDATFPLRAVAFDSGATVFTGPVEWSSLDPQILAVDDTGAVRALSAGWGRVVVRSANTSLADTALVAVGVRLAHISAGYDYGCGWMTDGTGYCWGAASESYRGILGTGSPPSSITPAPVAGGLHFSEIATGERHTCAIAGGSVYCWGSRNQHVLGFLACPPGVLDANGGCHAPGRVDLPDTWDHVAVGTSGGVGASCVSGPDGLTCWGVSSIAAPQYRGGLYSGPRLLSPDLTGAVALGSLHGCALDGGGRVFCWGDNKYGQLGTAIPPLYCVTPACEDSNTPIPAATGERFVDLVAGTAFNCGLTAAGQAFCWGRYIYDVGAPPLPGATPVAVPGGQRFRSLDAGHGHVCGLTSDGAMYCWGHHASTGALGEPVLDFNEVVLEPRHVAPSLTFTDVAAGAWFTCGITTGGTTVCLGSHSGLGQGFYSVQSTSPLPLAPPGPLPGYISNYISIIE